MPPIGFLVCKCPVCLHFSCTAWPLYNRAVFMPIYRFAMYLLTPYTPKNIENLIAFRIFSFQIPVLFNFACHETICQPAPSFGNSFYLWPSSHVHNVWQRRQNKIFVAHFWPSTHIRNICGKKGWIKIPGISPGNFKEGIQTVFAPVYAG